MTLPVRSCAKAAVDKAVARPAAMASLVMMLTMDPPKRPPGVCASGDERTLYKVLLYVKRVRRPNEERRPEGRRLHICCFPGETYQSNCLAMVTLKVRPVERSTDRFWRKSALKTLSMPSCSSVPARGPVSGFQVANRSSVA